MAPEWAPWVQGGGALVCALVFWLVQPWSGAFSHGRRAFAEYRGAWLLPAVLVILGSGLAAIWSGDVNRFTVPADDGAPPARVAAMLSADSLTQLWTGFPMSEALALTAAMAWLTNAAGFRRGMTRGLESVGGPGAGRWAVLIPLGLGALLAGLAARFFPAWPEALRGVLLVLAAPLAAWASAVLLGGLWLFAETQLRAPEKTAQVRWLETAAAHSARLWPWIAVGVVVWVLRALVPGAAWPWLRALWWLGAAAFPVAVLVFLHVKTPAGFTAGRIRQGEWLRGMLPAWLVWLLAAGLAFFLWHFGTVAFFRYLHGASLWLVLPLACLAQGAHTWLSVWMLHSAASLFLALAPPPPAKPRRKRAAPPDSRPSDP